MSPPTKTYTMQEILMNGVDSQGRPTMRSVDNFDRHSVVASGTLSWASGDAAGTIQTLTIAAPPDELQSNNAYIAFVTNTPSTETPLSIEFQNTYSIDGTPYYPVVQTETCPVGGSIAKIISPFLVGPDGGRVVATTVSGILVDITSHVYILTP